MLSDTKAPDRSAPRVAYLMSWFPKLTETFVLYELLAVERHGIHVAVFPLRKGRERLQHAEAKQVVERAFYTPLFSLGILASNLTCLLSRPATYLKTFATLFRANWGSWRYWTAAMLFFPKAIHLAQVMRREKIGHIHAHFASHPAAVAFVIHCLTGIPFSFTAHGSDLHRDQHMLKEKVNAAAFVVAISNYNREVILQCCGGQFADRIQIVHCGVDLETFRPAGRADQASESSPSIFCVGTMHEVKGQKYLLRACQRLRERDVKFQLHFIGDGPDFDSCRQLASDLGLSEQVTFHGRRPRSEIASLLSRADIVAAPSVPTADGRREGIPVALMEAMASGAAVIASRLSGIPELIQDGENGLLVQPRDEVALADGLQRLIDDGQLRGHLASNAHKTIEQHFHLDENAKHLAKYFVDSATAAGLVTGSATGATFHTAAST